MKGKFKRYQGWCEYCDKDYVPDGKKCHYCGNKQYSKSKIKKPKTKQILKKEE
jgi:hypothetical protein